MDEHCCVGMFLTIDSINVLNINHFTLPNIAES